jgi:predicted nucleic acid-binding protein
MIAADSSALVAFFRRQPGGDRLDGPILSGHLVCPPVVVTELLSSTRFNLDELSTIASIPMMPLLEGYWSRAGLLRASLMQRGLKAGLGDALIAQSCIDADIALITLDRDFRHFARFGGLRLAT